MASLRYLDPLAALRTWQADDPQFEMSVGYDVLQSEADGGLSGRTSFSVGELWRDTLAFSAALHDRGIGAGDAVAIQLPNWPEYLMAHLAVLAAGAVTVPISSILRTHDVARQLELSRAKILIVPGVYGKFDFAAMGTELARRLASLETVICVRGDGRTGAVLDLAAVLHAGSGRKLARVRAQIARGEMMIDPTGPAIVNYTSGSTGIPKGVMHSLASASAHVRPVVELLGLSKTDTFLIPTSLGHAAGFLNGIYIPMATSSKVVYMDRWQAGVAMRIMRAENVTYAPAMPTYLVDIMAHPDFHQASLSSWRAARVSGGPINGAVLKRMAAELPHLGLFRGWGMTEALMITGCGPHDPPEKRLATDGRPLGGARVIIRSPDSAEDCPAWITGEVLVRSESTMLGYYEQPELTGSAYTADGWLRSGDLGYLDDEGYLTIAGRIKDLVIRGGENVPVKDVEELIAELPSVRQVCVVGVPDARLGEKVCAVVQSAGSTTLAEIRAHLISRQLTRQFIPELLVLVEHLPSSSVSKVQRDEVREIALARLSECA